MSYSTISKNRLKQYGFLLLEALLAIAVFSAGTVAIMQTYKNSIAAGIISQQYLIASNLLEQVIWDAVSPKMISAGETSGQCPQPYEDFQWKVSIEETMPAVPEVDEAARNTELAQTGMVQEDKQPQYALYTIKASVFWKYKTDDKELVYETATIRKLPEEDTEDIDGSYQQEPQQQ